MVRKIKYWISLVTISLLLAACGDSEYTETVREQKPVVRSTPTLDLVVNDPSEFLPFIHQAIRLDSLELLELICHPNPERVRNDQTRSFCTVGKGATVRKMEFKRLYQNSVVQGDIWSKGDTAWIPTKLANGDKYSIHVLERANNQWYLVLMGISD